MSKFKLITTVLLLAILLIACSSDDENGAEPEENEPVTEEENNENAEDNDESEDSESENSDNDTTESDNGKESTSNSGKVLNLGETGAVESTLGDYEITFESFQLLDELEGEEPPDDDVYVLMETKVTNTGDESLNGTDLYSSSLFTTDGIRDENNFHNDSVNFIEGTIEPGDSVEGQFLFSIPKSDTYELVYNHGLSAFATELTWKFSVDEASN